MVTRRAHLAWKVINVWTIGPYSYNVMSGRINHRKPSPSFERLSLSAYKGSDNLHVNKKIPVKNQYY
jgi:hypothetical protein